MFNSRCILVVSLALLSSHASSQCSAQPIKADDVALGLSNSDIRLTLETVRGPRTELGGEVEASFWEQPFIQAVEFDNLNGLSHNPEGNLLGLNFGPSSDDGGGIYNLAAAEEVGDSQQIGDTLGLGGEGITSTRLGGLSISPNNTKIAVTGFDSARVIVYDYQAGNGRGAGAALTGARETSDGFLTAFDTQGTSWLDSNRVLAFATDGSVVQIDAQTMDSTTVAKVETGGGGDTNRSEFTDLEYNPAVSPYVYASYGSFDRDSSATQNSLYILDPRDNFNLVNEIDNSMSMETAREIALDTEGNLLATQFSATIELIPNADDPTNVADNTSIDWYLPLETSSFSGLDVAIGLPIDLGVEGDFDGNGVLDAVDIDLLTDAANGGSDDPMFDLNADGAIDSEDRRIWVVDLKKTYFGDANLDLEFGSGDLVAVFAAGKYENQQPAGWAEGDWDGNSIFESGDLVAAFADGGYELGPRENVAAVPEPSACLLACLGILSIIASGRRPGTVDGQL